MAVGSGAAAAEPKYTVWYIDTNTNDPAYAGEYPRFEAAVERAQEIMRHRDKKEVLGIGTVYITGPDGQMVWKNGMRVEPPDRAPTRPKEEPAPGKGKIPLQKPPSEGPGTEAGSGARPKNGREAFLRDVDAFNNEVTALRRDEAAFKRDAAEWNRQAVACKRDKDAINKAGEALNRDVDAYNESPQRTWAEHDRIERRKARWIADNAAVNARIDDLEGRQADLKKREAELDQRKAEIEKRRADLKKREAALDDK
jgi:hypothetical protein